MKAKERTTNTNTSETIVAQFEVLTETHAFPAVGAADAVTLGRWLVSAEPEDLKELALHHLAEIEAATKKLSELIEPSGKGTSRREISSKFDAMWSSFHAHLEATARLPIDAPEVDEAKEIYGLLFDNEGLAWLRQGHTSKWGMSSSKIARIEKTPGLRKRVIAATSKLLLESVEDAHLELGEAIGIGVPGLKPEGSDFIEPLRQLRTAVGDYVRVVLGDVDKREPSSAIRAELALAPIGRFRSLVNARRGSSGASASEVEVEPAAEPITAPASPLPFIATVSAGTPFPVAPVVPSPVPENGVGPATP
jgi:hypothetical protein